MSATLTAPPIQELAPNIVIRVKDGALNIGKYALLVVGIALLGACFIASMGGDPAHKTRIAFSYLTAYMGTLGICLCALFFVMVQHITRAGWSVGVRRFAENLAGALPLMALLFIPIYLSIDQLYEHWTHPHEGDEVLLGKHGWLNKGAFSVRAVLYFTIWLSLTFIFRRWSLKQDDSGDPALSLRMSRVAAPGILLFALSITFASFDWIMSLDPHWFSTIFGVCYFSGSYMAFFAFTILLTKWITGKGYMRESINTEHYHDLGKLLFTFMVFWTYTNFSQYMLISYANLPEETSFFAKRLDGGWGAVGTMLIFGHFLFPFAFLMSRHIKRNGYALGFGAVFLLVLHWIDMQFLIMPNAMAAHGADAGGADGAAAVSGQFGAQLSTWLHGMQWTDAACYLGMLCLVGSVTLINMCRHNLIPTRDPRLSEALNFQNL
ncbi:hypothetical protein LBMAG49_11190 [Planctomycetota bacterium]|nr:hypothetical protein [Planctomycetota bacterium]GDY01790.1 hypothetical protein LBMAG49_11190 [Planctomycetota bacterium]